MHPLTTHRRVPVAGVDRIDRADLALTTVMMAVARPARHEVIAVVLDDARRGVAIVVVQGAERPHAVVEVVELLTHPCASGGRIGALIVASVRPGGAMLPADVDHWLDASDIADANGVELVEWFVIGERIECPRDALGEPPRW